MLLQLIVRGFMLSASWSWQMQQQLRKYQQQQQILLTIRSHSHTAPAFSSLAVSSAMVQRQLQGWSVVSCQIFSQQHSNCCRTSILRMCQAWALAKW